MGGLAEVVIVMARLEPTSQLHEDTPIRAHLDSLV